jgi:hypothetical protein
MEENKIIINGHEAVDLGLSVKWATCNIGANRLEECGDYFAWGETSPKDVYTEESYLYYDVANNRKLIDIGAEISGTEYDAASKQWGDDWRMPTEEELYELLSYCSWQWITINGVNGYKVIGPNGNSIFLPAAGTFNSEHNECGCYWTGSFSDEDCHWDALNLQFDEFYHYSSYAQSYEGLVIRPVTKLIDFHRRFSLYFKTKR